MTSDRARPNKQTQAVEPEHAKGKEENMFNGGEAGGGCQQREAGRRNN